jgi:hypothetical protein
MLRFEQRGDFKNTERFLKKMSSADLLAALKNLAQEGVRALSAATPVDSGLTANSWGYEITRSKSSSSITWTNSNIVAGKPIAIMLQYGHGTGTGGYVRGRDYINPAIQPVFDKIAEEAWKVVTSA